MAVLPVGIGPVTGYNIERSLRFNSADTPYLNRTPGSAGNRQKFTISVWYKPCGISTGLVNANIINAGGDGSSLLISGTGAFGATYDNRMLFREAGTTLFYWPMVFRDPSAWYHIVFAMDTTQATAADRAKLYVNGVDQGAFSGTAITQNTNTSINNTSAHYIGTFNGTSYPNNLYYTEYYLIDGQALTPSSFGLNDPETGIWSPKAYTGTYGTNGFYLNFSDNSNTTATTLGKDYSGNGNNWTPSGFSVASGAGNDSLVDTPTSYGTDTGVGGEVRGNYATLNPLDKGSNLSTVDGNLQVNTTTGSWNTIRSTIGITSGKFYWEFYATNTANAMGGITTSAASISSYIGSDAYGWSYNEGDGNKYNNGIGSAYGATYTTNNIIGVAFDADNGTLTFYKDNSSQGTAFTGLTSGPYFPAFAVNNSLGVNIVVNFGQRPFAHTAPSGFKALCTANLPTPTIGATSTTQAGNYFNVVLWTGNDASRTITGYGFQPDFIWTKGRNVAAGHRLSDAVRGASGGTMLNLNTASTGAENTDTAITGFASDGFTMDGSNHPNVSPYTYVGWGWNAGGSNATNTSGTITSTVRANTTAGFSIVKFVTNVAVGGTWTTGHGLGVVPAMVIYKRTNSADSWLVYHGSISTPQNNYLTLNTTNAVSASSGIFNGMTTSLLGSTNSFVQNGDTLIAYCFAAVAGYSAFGSYTGNGSTDGPFIYTGFRPRWLLVKQSSSSGVNWRLLDTARDPYNVVGLGLTANTSDAETSGDTFCDILSNGFKVRQSTAAMNTSSATYIYAAFAESPFKYSLAR